ncbi:MerR family transcriptional regulator [Deinococcus sp. RM]|uniref:MerR family transcriptional regulator n=1 Tax=Deinococcus sp. RM TaxID=2316359 RepID=UPI000E693434|nr:MerR family transcriptional regulator [Deinococcus sp. RM]RIY04302.1 MerR family transcriptional regulator [Deinococcus sp. RM]
MNELTEAAFRQSVRQFRELMTSMPEAQRADVATMCGGPEVLDALFEERGVGIGRFAELMGLPATTVRHLLREDLLHPMRVNGKFRFLLHNVIELRGVQQWQAVGLTLEDTRAFLDAQGLLGLVAQGGTMFSVQREAPDPAALPALKADVLARLGGAVRSLEDRHAALGAQLARARALERMVQENAFGQSGPESPPR